MAQVLTQILTQILTWILTWILAPVLATKQTCDEEKDHNEDSMAEVSPKFSGLLATAASRAVLPMSKMRLARSSSWLNTMAPSARCLILAMTKPSQ